MKAAAYSDRWYLSSSSFTIHAMHRIEILALRMSIKGIFMYKKDGSNGSKEVSAEKYD